MILAPKAVLGVCAPGTTVPCNNSLTASTTESAVRSYAFGPVRVAVAVAPLGSRTSPQTSHRVDARVAGLGPCTRALT